MIIVMQKLVKKSNLNKIIKYVKIIGLQPVLLQGTERQVIAVIGDERILNQKAVEAMPGVEKVMQVLAPYKLASRESNAQTTIVNINGKVHFGAKKIVIIAGNCAIENQEITSKTAKGIRQAGAVMQRGGAFKPRTSPYSFQGLGEEGLKILKRAKAETGLPIVTEVMDPRLVNLVAEYADMLQIGARNMQNFDLLKEVGKVKKPILLKRGMSATIEDLLMSAEYILSQGNPNVVLCERGIRTFETATRNTLDISAVSVLKSKTHLPVIVDPSHAAGHRQFVPSLSKAAIAAGADGLIIEIHPNPAEAASDGEQTLNFNSFKQLMVELKDIAQAVGREI